MRSPPHRSALGGGPCRGPNAIGDIGESQLCEQVKRCRLVSFVISYYQFSLIIPRRLLTPRIRRSMCEEPHH